MADERKSLREKLLDVFLDNEVAVLEEFEMALLSAALVAPDPVARFVVPHAKVYMGLTPLVKGRLLEAEKELALGRPTYVPFPLLREPDRIQVPGEGTGVAETKQKKRRFGLF